MVQQNYYASGSSTPSWNIIFLYAHTGIIGFIYGSNVCIYHKDIFGNVISLWSGNTMAAKYEYDAWGNCKVLNPDGTENTDANFVGNINPIRYRSYYFDTDLGLYYLQTRWYDPETGRFINLDQIQYIDPESLNGLNLYAYCLNNPVMGVDPDGTSFLTFLCVLLGILVSGAISGALAADSREEGESYWGAFLGGFIDGVTGAIAIAAGLATGGIGGLAITAIVSFVGGFTGNIVSQAISYGDIDYKVAALQGGASAFFNSIMYIGFSVAGMVSGSKWIDRFIDALKISEIVVGISIFFMQYSLPSLNGYRGKI